MKVVLNTPERLVIESRPWWPGLMAMTFILTGAAMTVGIYGPDTGASGPLIGVPFMAMGALAFWAFVRRSQITLDRPNGTIEIRRKSITSETKVTHDLSDLSRAETETSRSSDGGTYRSVLVLTSGMSAGRHPVTMAYYSGSGAERITEAINRWLS